MANTVKATGRSIDEAFKKYHAENPQVYDMFKEQVLRAVRRKREKVSANAIINWIRWEVSLDIRTKETYKINDHYSSRYARLFVMEHPHYEHMFEFREIRAGKDPLPKEKRLEAALSGILRILKDGGHINHHQDNDSVALLDRRSASQPITKVQFNKLLKNHYIALAGQQSLITRRYGISTKGQSAA